MQAEELDPTCDDTDGDFSKQAWAMIVSFVDLSVDQVWWSLIINVEHPYSREGILSGPVFPLQN